MRNRPTRSEFQARMKHFIESIKEARDTGEFKAGTYLPSEMELAKRYHLSKLSIRKGLEQLVKEGVIEKIPRVGNRVLPRETVGQQVVRFACHSSLIKEAAVDELIERFEAANPDIKVEMIPFPFQQYLEMIDHYVDHDLIDVLTMNFDQFMQFSKQDRIKLLEPQQPDPAVYDGIEEGFMHEGQLFAKAFIFSPIILCYNPEHFRSKQLPEPDQDWTWSDLLDAAKQLADQRERYGFYFHLLSQNRWPVFLLQNGYSYVRDKPDHSERFLESMALCKTLISDQGVTMMQMADNDLQAEFLFMKEKASMIMTSYFNLNYLADSGVAYEISPLPYIHEPKSLRLAIAIGVMRQTPRKEAAQRFADFLTSYESQLYIRQHRLSIPAVKEAAEWKGQHACYQPKRYDCYEEMLPALSYYNELGISPNQMMQLRKELTLYWSDLYSERQLLDALHQILAL